LSVIEILAARLPVAAGVNVTFMVQLAPATRLLGVIGQLLVCAKSLELVPVIPMLAMERVAVPVFVSVTLCGELVVPVG